MRSWLEMVGQGSNCSKLVSPAGYAIAVVCKLTSTMAFNPEVFRWARETAGLDLDAAAHAVGIVAASLVGIERGEKEPSRTTLLNMAKA